MALDFDNTTQRLVLKTEYSLDITELTIKKMAFAGVTYDALILSFDPSLVLESEYQYYYENGLDYIFDIVTI
jgi:hypothetical protein